MQFSGDRPNAESGRWQCRSKTLSLFLQGRIRQETKKIAPRSRLERNVAEIWQEVLGKEILDIHENFFDVGGSSLLMARVNGQLKKRLQLNLPITHLFQYPTINELVRYYSGATPRTCC